MVKGYVIAWFQICEVLNKTLTQDVNLCYILKRVYFPITFYFHDAYVKLSLSLAAGVKKSFRKLIEFIQFFFQSVCRNYS